MACKEDRKQGGYLMTYRSDILPFNGVSIQNIGIASCWPASLLSLIMVNNGKIARRREKGGGVRGEEAGRGAKVRNSS